MARHDDPKEEVSLHFRATNKPMTWFIIDSLVQDFS